VFARVVLGMFFPVALFLVRVLSFDQLPSHGALTRARAQALAAPYDFHATRAWLPLLSHAPLGFAIHTNAACVITSMHPTPAPQVVLMGSEVRGCVHLVGSNHACS
jgi:hypothetical protein